MMCRPEEQEDGGWGRWRRCVRIVHPRREWMDRCHRRSHHFFVGFLLAVATDLLLSLVCRRAMCVPTWKGLPRST